MQVPLPGSTCNGSWAENPGYSNPFLFFCIISKLVGGFNTSEKYESQMGVLFPIYGKIKHVPNHQPDNYHN